MFGAQKDVLGFAIQKAGPGDQPENRFITQDNMLGLVDVACQLNPKALFSSQRNVPFAVITRPQGVRTRLQNQEEQVFSRGGLAWLPDRWKEVR